MTDEPSYGFGKERLQGISDGVFSVALTLLVLELITEKVTDAASEAELRAALLALWPKLLSYMISFAVAAYFWVAQHSDLHHLERTDGRHIWINILFLFWVSLLPFAAALLGEHHAYAIAEMVYGGILILATLTLHAGWRYVAGRRALLKPGLDAEAIRRAHRRLLLGPPIYLIAIAVASFSPHASFQLYILTAILYVLSGVIPGWLRLRALATSDDA